MYNPHQAINHDVTLCKATFLKINMALNPAAICIFVPYIQIYFIKKVCVLAAIQADVGLTG